jgi:hypothetical protein
MAGPSIVQTTKSADTNDGSANTVATQAFGSAPTQHDGIQVEVFWIGTATGNITSVTDNATGGSNTYVQQDVVEMDTSAAGFIASYICKDLKAGASALTVTANFGTNVTFRRIHAQQVTGIDNTTQPDNGASGHAINHSSSFGTGANAATSGNLTTDTPNCLVIGMADNDTAARVPSLGTGFAAVDSGTFSAGDAFRVESQTKAAAGTIAATFTLSTGTDAIGIVAVAWKPAPPIVATLEQPNRPRPGRGPFSTGQFYVADYTPYTPPPIVQGSGTATITFGQSGAITGTGKLAGTATITLGQSGTLKGKGALAGTTGLTFGQSGAVKGSGALHATNGITFGETGALTGKGALAGAGHIVFGESGALTQPFSFGTITFAGTATLTGKGALAGSASLIFGAQANNAIVVASTSKDAGRKRKRYYVEIDGQQFQVADAQEAQALLTRAKELASKAAERQAQQIVQSRPKSTRIELPAPTITVSPELEVDTRPLRNQLVKIYRDTSVDVELRLLLELQQRLEDDDAEAILLLS